MALGSDGNNLCATSGDGTLAVYDMRKSGEKGLVAMSDFQEDEYLSLAIVKHGTKVVCGSQTGALAIFTWGDFGDLKDRIKGHPMSVDAVVKLSEERILTGSSDGLIRVVSVHSRDHGSRVLSVLGEHGEGGYPLERLSLSADGTLVASASHGQPSVQIWPTDVALNTSGAQADGAAEGTPDSVDSDDSDEPRARRKKRRKGGAKGPVAESARKAGSFFSGL
ncbi:unnamed protein product [Prorocentrum cordatum]|uniref:WD repeat-containing protein 55 n=1 Tax=Prorocentrum cordatum TaxID=2364126 RepID=A0ABN9QNT2_9DINO|nr:unnamed protein product [Polarella glacialis]